MTVDEYENIRLIDLEGFNQENCARQMNIARSTVQNTYSEARKKTAEALVKGALLLIEGGEYRLCEGEKRDMVALVKETGKDARTAWQCHRAIL